MTINEWAGIIALPISIINLGITIYKEFFKKPKLTMEILNLKWVPRENGIVDFQFSIRVKAINGDVYLRGVRLINKKHQLQSLALISPPDFNALFATDEQNGCYYPFTHTIEYQKKDLTDSLRFMEKLGELKDKGIREVEELKVRTDSVEILTFAGRLIGTVSSEWITRQEIPNESWYFQIIYDQGKQITYQIR